MKWLNKRHHIQDIADIQHEFESVARCFFEYIFQENFILTLVGGGALSIITERTKHCRDFPYDLDFEIRSNAILEKGELEKCLSDLFDKLVCNKKLLGIDKIQFEKKFFVIKIEIKKWVIELAAPRLEYYAEQYCELDIDCGHRDFEIVVNNQLSYNDSFNRRDFTINSIGLEFCCLDDFLKLSGKIIDPYDGLNDLKNKLLRSVNKNFSRDPVRLLRLVRFKNNLNFNIENGLEKEFEKFNLSRLSVFFFRREIEKSFSMDFFLQSLLCLVKKNNIKTPSFFCLLTGDYSSVKIVVWDDLFFLVVKNLEVNDNDCLRDCASLFGKKERYIISIHNLINSILNSEKNSINFLRNLDLFFKKANMVDLLNVHQIRELFLSDVFDLLRIVLDNIELYCVVQQCNVCRGLNIVKILDKIVQLWRANNSKILEVDFRNIETKYSKYFFSKKILSNLLLVDRLRLLKINEEILEKFA